MIKFNKNLKRINKISQKIGILNARIFGGGFEPLALGAADGDVEFDDIRIFRPSARASVSDRVSVAKPRHHRAAFPRFRRKLRRRRRFCGGFRGGLFRGFCHFSRNVRAHARPWQAKNARPTVYKRARPRPNSSGGVFLYFFSPKSSFFRFCRQNDNRARPRISITRARPAPTRARATARRMGLGGKTRARPFSPAAAFKPRPRRATPTRAGGRNAPKPPQIRPLDTRNA